MKMEKYKRYNFSLTPTISKEINLISLLPREFRCSRSDVIKGAIKAFLDLPEEKQIEYLKTIHFKN